MVEIPIYADTGFIFQTKRSPAAHRCGLLLISPLCSAAHGNLSHGSDDAHPSLVPTITQRPPGRPRAQERASLSLLQVHPRPPFRRKGTRGTEVCCLSSQSWARAAPSRDHTDLGARLAGSHTCHSCETRKFPFHFGGFQHSDQENANYSPWASSPFQQFW